METDLVAACAGRLTSESTSAIMRANADLLISAFFTAQHTQQQLAYEVWCQCYRASHVYRGRQLQLQ